MTEQQLVFYEARERGRAEALEAVKRVDSPAVAELARLLDRMGGWQREFRFHRVRSWRFDFAQPEVKIGIEVDGGLYTHGRHVRVYGYAEDCIKRNEAQLEGWWVLNFTNEQVLDGTALAMIVQAQRLRLAGAA